MSTQNYSNPLDNFRSHSYHFILVLANTTETLRSLIDGGDGFMSNVNNTKLGEKVRGSQAYLLIDTRRYSQYSITQFETEQVYGTGNTTNPSVPSSLSKMRVVDTTGLSFFNFVSDTMKNKLKSTRASSFFMLAIVFTGHDDSKPTPVTRTISTTFIPLMLVTMAFEFSSSGSVYDIEFVEMEGNPGQGVPQVVDLGDIQTVSTENKANTLGGMLQALEDRLNHKSKEYYNKYSNDSAGGKGKLVQYMITWPPEWTSFLINTAGKDKNTEQVFVTSEAAAAAKMTASTDVTKSPTKAKSSYHSFSYSTSVQDAIKVILESAKDFIDLAGEKKRVSGNAVVQKTVINVTSDDSVYLIHFDIYPFKAPKVDLAATGTPNLIKYDYIFTGKNSHVLDLKIQFDPHSAAVGLDMDLNMGQSKFKDLGQKGQSTKAVEAESTGTKKTSDFSPTLRDNDPVFLPPKTREQQRGFGGQINEEMNKDDALGVIRAKQEHTASMAAIHFMGSLQTQMTIRGNPNLLRKYADRQSRNGIAPHTLSKEEYFNSYVAPRHSGNSKGEDSLMAGPDVAVGPVFVKINIMAPNVDYQGNQIQNAPMFTNEFFYKGAYFVATITHSFDQSSFKQVLSLLAWNIDGTFSEMTAK